MSATAELLFEEINKLENEMRVLIAEGKSVAELSARLADLRGKFSELTESLTESKKVLRG
jgi:hypothetical protein